MPNYNMFNNMPKQRRSNKRELIGPKLPPKVARQRRQQAASDLVALGAYRPKTKRTLKRLAVRGKGKYDMPTSPWGLVPRGLAGGYNWLRGRGFEDGWNTGADISRALGLGSYGIPWKEGPGYVETTGPPSITNGADESIVISKEEYLTTVHSTTDYTVQSWNLNPGLNSVFKWTSGVARNFQNYRIEKMLVRYESQLTNAVASFESMGSMMLCGKTNAAANAPATQAEFEQTEFATVFRPNLNMVAPIEMNPVEGAGGVKLVRFDQVIGPSTSINDYDSGKLFAATSGMPVAGVEIGRLYLNFVVRLYNPVLNTSLFPFANYKLTTCTALGMLGTTVAPLEYTDTFPGLTFPDPGSVNEYNRIVIPAGNSGTYIVELAWNGASAGSGALSMGVAWDNVIPGGFTWFLQGGGGSSSEFYPNAASSRCLWRGSFTIDDPLVSSSLALSNSGGFPVGTVTGNLTIQRVVPNSPTTMGYIHPTGEVGLTKDEVLRMIREHATLIADEKDEMLSVHSAAASAAGRPRKP